MPGSIYPHVHRWIPWDEDLDPGGLELGYFETVWFRSCDTCGQPETTHRDPHLTPFEDNWELHYEGNVET